MAIVPFEAVRATSRFHRELRHFSPDAQECVRSWVGELIHEAQSSNRHRLANIRKHKNSGLFRLSGLTGSEQCLRGYRAIVDVSGASLDLYSVGDHQNMEGFTREDRLSAESTLSPWTNYSIGPIRDFEDIWRHDFEALENTTQWIYVLDHQQRVALDRVFDLYLERRKKTEVHIVGGPGTGKTSILLNLLYALADEYPSTTLVTHRLMRDYLLAWGQLRVGRWCSYEDLEEINDSGDDPYHNLAEAKVILADDPASQSEIDRLRAVHRRGQLLVIAYDPEQLKPVHHLYDALTDEDIAQYEADVDLFVELSLCYRQRKLIGKRTKPMLVNLSSASKYLREEKTLREQSLRERVRGYSSSLVFTNPGGRVWIVPSATVAKMKQTLDEWLGFLRGRELWENWPAFLVLFDQDIPGLDSLVRQLWMPLGSSARILSLEEVFSIRGSEFQHVVMYLRSLDLDRMVTGFRGLGAPETNRLRSLRIPLTRSRDSTVIYGIG